MKQLTLAVANYHDAYGEFPPAVTYGSDGKPAHSWRVLILEMMGDRDLYERYSFDEPWDGPNNRTLATEMPSPYAFAGTHVPGESTSTNFVAITGEETVWPLTKPITYLDIGDPHSRTIQFAEYNGTPIHWMSPVDLEFSKMSFKLGDSAGIDSQYVDPAVGMVDGIVVKLDSTEISEDRLRAMCTANANDATPLSKHLQEMEDARMRKLRELMGEADSKADDLKEADPEANE